MPSLYLLKPRFQQLLRPLVRQLAQAGVTANQVTLFACAASAGLGLFLIFAPARYFLLLPFFLLVRMALNAVDGMLAREHGQKSALGAYLNELTDVIADSFLYLPFAFVPGFSPIWIAATLALAGLSEMTGVVAVCTGASRRYDGPFGKSDRAFAFGLLGLWLGLVGQIPGLIAHVLPEAFAALLVGTIVNRIRGGLRELARRDNDAVNCRQTGTGASRPGTLLQRT